MANNAVTTGSSADIMALIDTMPTFVQSASRALTKCVKATRAEDGTSTLTLKIKILSKNGGENVEIVPQEPTASLPKKKLGSRMFFTSDHGQLLRDNPNQFQLPIEDEPKVTRE